MDNNFNNYDGNNNYNNNNNYNGNFNEGYNQGGYNNPGQYGNAGYQDYNQQQAQQPYHYMTEDERRGMMSRTMTGTFVLMFLGLLVTAVTAFGTLALTVASESLFNFIYASYGYYVFIFAELGIVIFLSARLQKMKSGTAIAMFFLYALVSGITLSIIFFAYTAGTIILAFATASAMFGVMAVYGAVTKKNLSSMGSLLLMGLFGIIIATMINMFLQINGLYTIIAYIGVALFLGLTAYDTQKIKAMVNQSNSAEETRKIAVYGALNLYLDMINIFLYILRIFGRRSN